MAAAGLRSCLILPLRTDREPGGALAIYGAQPGCFTGAGHDVALLFAAQGGVAIRNAALHRSCRRLVENLQVALESRAVIEQAKGILVAEYGYPPDVAFKRLSCSRKTSTGRSRTLPLISLRVGFSGVNLQATADRAGRRAEQVLDRALADACRSRIPGEIAHDPAESPAQQVSLGRHRNPEPEQASDQQDKSGWPGSHERDPGMHRKPQDRPGGGQRDTGRAAL
jgi:hypothetical protein